MNTIMALSRPKSLSQLCCVLIMATMCPVITIASDATAAPFKLDANYTNKSQGLFLQFPGGWCLEDLGTQPGGRWDLLLVNPSSSKNNSGIHLTVYRNKETVIRNNEDEEKVFLQLKKEHETGESTLTEGKAEVGGRNSRTFTVKHSKGFETRYSKVIVTSTEQALYVFRCFMDDPEDVDTARLLDAIMAQVAFRYH